MRSARICSCSSCFDSVSAKDRKEEVLTLTPAVYQRYCCCRIEPRNHQEAPICLWNDTPRAIWLPGKVEYFILYLAAGARHQVDILERQRADLAILYLVGKLPAHTSPFFGFCRKGSMPDRIGIALMCWAQKFEAQVRSWQWRYGWQPWTRYTGPILEDSPWAWL